MKHAWLLGLLGLTATTLAQGAEDALAKQLTQMRTAANGALDTWVYTVGDIDVTAWMDSQPVIIKVPILDENRQHVGDSDYFFKQGRLFAVTMPYGRYQFDEQGNLLEWLDETGQMSELPGSPAWAARQQWLQKRAAQLAAAFVPGEAVTGALDETRLSQLCLSRFQALSGASMATLAQHQTELPAKPRLTGQLAVGDKQYSLDCEVNGAQQVSRLTYRVKAVE
ncbi:hypothetical protein [Pseudaeromonas paramecii]|uniref:Uncharacterized protein n=1 Tax=Pseudaeromonas paramecii TaxID=2138166 RepID=A0ABP8QK91_9GAMM